MNPAAELLVGLVFIPLLAALAAVLLPIPHRRWAVLLGGLAWPCLLVPLSMAVAREQEIVLVFGGWAPPLGIGWRLDALALVVLWVHALAGIAALVSAWQRFGPGTSGSGPFWPLWMILATGVNAALLAADLFNLYVALELTTLAAVALIATDDGIAALASAMRYLLLAVLGSLMYLLGVGLVYADTGSLAMHQPGLEALNDVALVLMLTGLMVKAAIFPLHVWLPHAYSNAPGPVAAIMAAVVGKAALVALWRVWFETAVAPPDVLADLLGLVGAVAVVYGAVAAYLQPRLKMVVAYSSVSQFGLLMLLLPLASTAAFQGAGFHLLAHGLAKAAMFLAAANIVVVLGSDHIRHLPGLDKRMPVEALTLALAGVTLIGLPPSGGFTGKWMLLTAAWDAGGWFWLVLVVLSGLMSAAYVFRIAALTCFHPERRAVHHLHPRPPAITSLAALLLALLAIVIGLYSQPVLDLLGAGLPGIEP
ncbi:MAG: complex I subunit 5 family protein [Candidatus Wenzhouxiangella sp. M2_3B_020]